MGEATMPVKAKVTGRAKCRHCGGTLILLNEDGGRYCLLCCRPYTEWQEYGASGGQATLARYGREHMAEIGRRGGLASRLPTITEVRQQSAPQAQTQIKGGNRLPNQLSELKELWRERREELLAANSSSPGGTNA